MRCYDLVIIGAGPAGMSAATLAAKHGATVAVIDEQAQLGGQIYRHINQCSDQLHNILGPDYSEGKQLVDEFILEKIDYLSSSTVCDIDAENTVSYTSNNRAYRIQGKYLLLATGALERPFAIKGWTLPGVMTVGAAQILLKTSSLVSNNAVLAGSGPLVYLLAAQMVDAGCPPKAIIETQSWKDYIRASRHLVGALVGFKTLLKGIKLIVKLRQAKVKRYTAVSDITINGESSVEGIQFTQKGLLRSQQRQLYCQHVFLHQGVVSNTQISRALRLDHKWNSLQRSFTPVTNEWGQSSHPSVFISGDGNGINGAKAAQYAGNIAACEILFGLELISKHQRDSLSKTSKSSLNKERAPRPFLDTLYSVPDFVLRPQDDVMICRCEEVKAGDIRHYARLGCQGPNQTKAFGRSGMGPCQGRYCGLTVTELLAQAHHKEPAEIGEYRIRMPIKPISLGEVASLAQSDD